MNDFNYMIEQFEKVQKELEASTNPDLVIYKEKMKEILDALRKEKETEGQVDGEPRTGRIIEAACDMQAVSK